MSFFTPTSLCSFGGLLCLLFVGGTARAQELPDLKEALKVAKAADPLSIEERALAVRVAESALRAEKLLPDKKTFLTLVQSHRATEAEKKGVFERHALLTYYRYAGDTGLLVYVNLKLQTAKVEQLPHFPAPLAPEELQRAKELALGFPELKKFFEPYQHRLTVEALLTRSGTAKEPLFGHRLVHLFFRVGPRYLTEQGTILIDLTAETVIVTPPQTKEKEGGEH